MYKTLTLIGSCNPKNERQKDIIEKARFLFDQDKREVVIISSVFSHFQELSRNFAFLFMLVGALGVEMEDYKVIRFGPSENECETLYDREKENHEREKRQSEEKEEERRAYEIINEEDKRKQSQIFRERFSSEIDKKVMPLIKDVITYYAPKGYAYFSGNLTKIQMNVLNRVVKELQPYLRKSISRHSTGECTKVMPPGESIEVSIPLREFTESSHYEQAIEEVKNLLKKQIAYETNDDDGRRLHLVNIFSSASVPMEGGERMIKCSTTKEITEILCNPFLPDIANKEEINIKGYFPLHADAIESLSSIYSKRIYSWLAASERNFNNKLVLSVRKIRTMLAIENKYMRWHQFKERILEDTKNEMDENAYRFDLTFTYRPLYSGYKTTGFPEEIEFTVISNKEKREYLKFKKEITEMGEIMKALGLTESQIGSISNELTTLNINNVMCEIRALIAKANCSKLQNPPAYIYRHLKKKIGEFKKQ